MTGQPLALADVRGQGAALALLAALIFTAHKLRRPVTLLLKIFLRVECNNRTECQIADSGRQPKEPLGSKRTC